MDIPKDKPEFLRMLTKAMAAYARPLPDAAMIDSWIELLQNYPLRVIAKAFLQYIDENSEFEPKPAGIAKLCKLQDGRPGVEEAWAIAITSQDESETVVWTQEMAEAFGLCSSVLESGDEVGARMSFKETYVRLVTEARLNSRAVKWFPSIGWDVNKRSAALKKASVAGLLQSPVVAALLPPPAVKAESLDSSAREQLAKIKQMLADTNAERKREAEEWALQEKAKTDQRKKEINDQVRGFKDEQF